MLSEAQIAAARRRRHQETYTRVAQWRIVDSLLRDGHPQARTLLAREISEACIHAAHLGLPYRPGDRLTPFSPADYPDDQSLIRHIHQLTKKRTYLSREALIDIADHILTNIVEPGHTADHLPLVTAILSTHMPEFNYPTITKTLEKTTAHLAKIAARTHLDLAPTYYTLWTQTLKQTHLNHFQTTIRHCHRALTAGKQYPNLGIDKNDPATITRARTLLATHPQTLQTLGLK